MLRDKIDELFGIDLRSLAAFRIGLGTVLLVDLIAKSADLEAFYTDEGTLPRLALLTHIDNPRHLSLHFVSGVWEIEALLFVIATIAAVCLLVGRHTKLAAFVSWLL